MIEKQLIASLLLVYVVAMGACIGSFLNVVIARLPQGESVVRPGSRCPRCKKAILWYHNIPIISYFILLGKCRYCKFSIPPRYPLIEAVVAALMGALWVQFGLSWELALWVPLSAVFVAIAFIDIDHWIIPDILVYPSMLWVLGIGFYSGATSISFLLAGLIPAGLIFLVGWCFEKITGREGLGFGDVKLLALIGLAVGPLVALNVLLLSSLQGALVGIAMRLFTKGHEAQKGSDAVKEASDSHFDDGWVPPPHAIPFGPFLVLAALQSILLPHIFGDLGGKVSQLIVGTMG